MQVTTSVRIPNAFDAGPGRDSRRAAAARRFGHGRSRPPALFDRSEVLGASSGGRKGATMGDERAGAGAAPGVSGLNTAIGTGVGAGWPAGPAAGPAEGDRWGQAPGPVLDGGRGGIEARTGSDGARPAGARRRPARSTAPVAPAARSLLADASLGLGRACSAGEPADRYATAHLAALRGAAAVLAARARPTRGGQGSVWTLMTRVAPEFAEWAAFFAAGSAKRQAVQAGLPARVTAREADDLVRQVALFLSLVGDSIGSAAGR